MLNNAKIKLNKIHKMCVEVLWVDMAPVEMSFLNLKEVREGGVREIKVKLASIPYHKIPGKQQA